MAWVVAAEGASLSDLKQVIADRDLVKGTKIRAEINVIPGFGWLFDVAGAELAFLPFIPSGVDLIDVRGEGNKGIIDMEADPIMLAPLVAFIAANWLRIAIAGVVIATVVLSIKLLIAIEETLEEFLPFLLIVGLVIGGLWLVGSRERKRSIEAPAGKRTQ